MKNTIQESRENWMANEITKLRREINEMKYNQPLSVERVTTGSVGPITVNNNDYNITVVTLSSTDYVDKTLFIIPEVTIYKTSVSAANAYPSGANWSTANTMNFQVETYFDRAQSDGNNLKFYVIMKNATGGSLSCYFVADFRYVVGTV